MIMSWRTPSLLETMIGFPGAVIRLPSSAVAALDAINDMAERMDRLLTLLERIEGGVNRAGRASTSPPSVFRAPSPG